MGPHTAGRVPTAAFSAVYPVHCTKMTALSDKIAQNWGITLMADEVSKVRDEEDFIDLISSNLANNYKKG